MLTQNTTKETVQTDRPPDHGELQTEFESGHYYFNCNLILVCCTTLSWLWLDGNSKAQEGFFWCMMRESLGFSFGRFMLDFWWVGSWSKVINVDNSYRK